MSVSKKVTGIGDESLSRSAAVWFMRRVTHVDAMITGVGMTELTKNAAAGSVSLAAEALDIALADAQLEAQDIDGLSVHIGSPRGQDYDRLAESLGLVTRFSSQTWSHGRFMSTAVAHAGMAVSEGLADHVACVAAYRNSGFPRIGQVGNPFFEEVLREGGGPHGEQGGIGMLAPSGGAALAWHRYLTRYGCDETALAYIAITQRDVASRNCRAVLRSPLTFEEYRESPYVVEPLRRLDCSIPVDGAVCVIVSARRMAQDPGMAVRLAGVQGLHAGAERYIFGPRGLGLWGQSENRPTWAQAQQHPAYKHADVAVGDIDLFYTYDAFTPCVVFALEDYGFFGPGEAAAAIADGALCRDGRPWVNTNGGLLSEGHFNGWGHLHEMVQQVRGRAGTRQVAGANVAVWGALAGDALVLTAA